MRVHVAIDGQRSDQAVLVLLSAEDDQLVFTVPTVNRAAACTFSVTVGGLQEAVRHLAPPNHAAPRPAQP